MSNYNYRGKTLYHVTKVSNLDSIAEKGILPSSDFHDKDDFDLSFNNSCIYLTDSLDSAKSFAQTSDGDFVVLEISIDDLNLLSMRTDFDQMHDYLGAVSDTDILDSDEFPHIPWPLSLEKIGQVIYVEKIPPHIIKVSEYLNNNAENKLNAGEILNPGYVREVWKEKGEVKKTSFGFIQKFKTENEEDLIDFPDDIKIKFAEMGQLQRDLPERAMNIAQSALGGGVLSFCLEHVGDIYHRMTHHAKYGSLYHGLVDDKVQKTLRVLEHGYGFEKEHNENMVGSSTYNKTNLEEYIAKAKETTDVYAIEHKKLPIYNKAQYFAREASVALGEHNFDRAKLMLNNLKEITLDPNVFNRVASTVMRDKKGNLMEVESPDYVFDNNLNDGP
jgi:hypothetical protein